MQASDIPAKFQIPFGNAAGGGYVRSIPVASQIGVVDGAASLTDGFPPLNFLPVGSGGIPPFGQDFNGLLKQVTAWTRWQNAGNPVVYDATFSGQIGGYPKGAILAATTAGKFWLSIADNNGSNPDAGGANWVAFATGPQIQAQTYTYWVAGGTASALTITPTPAITANAAGQRFAVKLTTNLAAGATLAVSGQSALPLTYDASTANGANDFLSGNIMDVESDGTHWQIKSISLQLFKNTALKRTKTVITATGPYDFVVPAGITTVVVSAWGAGGGGGFGFAGSPSGGAAGGGGAAYLQKTLSVNPGDHITGSLGAAGANGTSGGSNGGVGGDTTVIYSATTYTAGGGDGGLGAAATTVSNSASPGSVSGSVDIARTGEPSEGGLLVGTGANTHGGKGGNSPNGGYGGQAGTGGANSGAVPGGGGGGSANSQTAGSGSRGEVWLEY